MKSCLMTANVKRNARLFSETGFGCLAPPICSCACLNYCGYWIAGTALECFLLVASHLRTQSFATRFANRHHSRYSLNFAPSLAFYPSDSTDATDCTSCRSPPTPFPTQALKYLLAADYHDCHLNCSFATYSQMVNSEKLMKAHTHSGISGLIASSHFSLSASRTAGSSLCHEELVFVCLSRRLEMIQNCRITIFTSASSPSSPPLLSTCSSLSTISPTLSPVTRSSPCTCLFHLSTVSSRNRSIPALFLAFFSTPA
jgi:hypothetical protein